MVETNLTLLEAIIEMVSKASDAVFEIYQKPIDFIHKADGSPLTMADNLSHHLLIEALEAYLPGAVLISEEDAIQDNRAGLNQGQFWLIDPLDGTKEFIHKNGEFTVNVALVEHGHPILGVVAAPALNVLYAGVVGLGAFKVEKEGERTPIKISEKIEDGMYVVGSRSHGNMELMDAYLADKPRVLELVGVGSSLKFCLLAEGRAHLYPRFGRTMEWDTAAGHAVLAAAGGRVELLDGGALCYGKKGFENPHFVAKSCTII